MTKSRPRSVPDDAIGLARINSEIDNTVARVFVKRPQTKSIEILYFTLGSSAYQCWLGYPKNTLVAMRNANETLPVFNHDFVSQ